MPLSLPAGKELELETTNWALPAGCTITWRLAHAEQEAACLERLAQRGGTCLGGEQQMLVMAHAACWLSGRA